MGGHPFLIRLRSRRCWPSDARMSEAPLRQPPWFALEPCPLEQTSARCSELGSRPQFILSDTHQQNSMIGGGAAPGKSRLSCS
jgi:hypothetical protein